MSQGDELTRLAQELTGAFLKSAWRLAELAESGAALLGRWPDWLESLSLSVVTAFRAPPIDRRSALVAYIEAFLLSHAEEAEHLPPAPPVTGSESRVAARAGRLRHEWPIAPVESLVHLAELLELSLGQLQWLADVKGLERRASPEQLRNYRYAIVPRRSGVPRVIEAPKSRLKEVQRWILREILDQIPAHKASHGFRPGRSVLTNARLHVAQPAVLRLDLKDFFASVAARRVFGIFTAIGYPGEVAHVLTGLCTNALPLTVWAVVPPATEPWLVQARFWLGRQLATPHLPQGAPTSPALATLAGFRLDRRLTGLATANGYRYSRYADDLTFSGGGELLGRRERFEAAVAEIARDEGFRLNEGKSRLQTKGSRQSVCGVVVNVRPNVVRAEYDQLRAILHNAAVSGPASQNHSGAGDFRAYLRGRIAWVQSLNPARGEKLMRRFEAIDWGPPP